MLQPLRDPGRRALLLLQELQEAIPFLAEGRELLLELGAIPEKLDELLFLVAMLTRNSE